MTYRTRAIQFPNPAGESLAGRLELPLGEPRASALFAHCFTCGKDIAAASRVARALAARGFAVLRFDFTGLGSSDGDFANSHFSANVGDLVAAAEWLKGEVMEPTLLVGHSLGGAAVLAAAGRLAGVRAVATIGAPSEPDHVIHLLEGRAEEIRTHGRADVSIAGRRFPISSSFLDDLEDTRLRPALGELGKQGQAVLILHSPQDTIVGVDHARRLFEALRHPKSFVGLEGADHLLTRKADAEYAADLIATWSARFLPEVDVPEGPAEGEVVVEGDAQSFLQHVTSGRHSWAADEPEAVGGGDAGPTPYEHLLAALGTCTSMTLGAYARHKQLPIGRIAVRLSHDRVHAQDCEACPEEPRQIDRIQRWLTVEGDLTEAQRARLLEIADRCPVHRTLHRLERIDTSWESGER